MTKITALKNENEYRAHLLTKSPLPVTKAIPVETYNVYDLTYLFTDIYTPPNDEIDENAVTGLFD